MNQLENLFPEGKILYLHPIPAVFLKIYSHREMFLFLPPLKRRKKAASSMTEEVFIIGGASVYRDTIKYADRLIISMVKENYQGDVYFPDYDKSEWELVSSEDFDEFILLIYERKF